MAIFKIHHITKYEYDRPVIESVNEIRIFPYQYGAQETLLHDLMITGNPDVLLFIDYWGNKAGVFNLLPPHKELVIESKLTVRTTASSNLNINFHSGFDELRNDIVGNLLLIELSRLEIIQAQDTINEIIQSIHKPESIATTVKLCSDYIFENFNYIKGITNIETTVDEILEHGAGVCQDFVHLMLQILRTLKIPSRYVSGYICPNKSGMRGEGATHAWVEVWIPANGWMGIDPTNNLWVTNHHVKLAVGRDFNDCSPVKGAFKGLARQKLSVYVSVSYEDGNIFEEMNNVQMQAQSALNDELLAESFAGQQQQQQ